MGMNGVPSEKGTRLADTNRAMIQVIVFVSYWPLLAYDVHRLAFPAAFFKPAYFRDRKGGITQRLLLCSFQGWFRFFQAAGENTLG